jgi:hypothetical protein
MVVLVALLLVVWVLMVVRNLLQGLLLKVLKNLQMLLKLLKG